MSTLIKHSIKAPYDPEMPEKVRDTLEYYVTLPSTYDKSLKYGVVFCIPGYGDTAVSEYQQNKLRPYIADKYNLIAVGVRYHNDVRTGEDVNVNIDGICSFYGIDKNYFRNINTFNILLEDLFNLIISRNIFSIDPRLSVKLAPYNKYSSFGFMPAIDHLNVLFNLMGRYNIDKRNIIAFGSSYGGYIASLMGKYAPGTFSMVIDNSGFSVTSLSEVFGGAVEGTGGAWVKVVNGRRYEVCFTANTLWSTDETSTNYFSDVHKQIRSLLVEEHRTPSQTMHCCFHSVKDKLCSINLKDEQYRILEKYNPVYYKRVQENDIDGKVFKNIEHGMNASLRSLFDISMGKYFQSNLEKDDLTDFDSFVTYGFPCLNKLYNFTYSDKGLDVNIESLSIN